MKGYCDAIDNYQADYESNERGIYLREMRVFHPQLQYSGTLDCLEVIDGVATIKDYKTVTKVDRKGIAVQMAGYYLALKAMGLEEIVKVSDTAKIVQLLPTGKYNVLQVKVSGDSSNVFTALTNLYNYFKED